ncbi:MAG: ribonuclease P protein component [Deltaproteobacteria bacterium]|nr:ribonuclease P protein component [Deltaproteobacteria bacterium]
MSGLSRTDRLQRPSQFLAVQRSGRRARCRSCELSWSAPAQQRASVRLGMIVSARVGPAVVRNRVKRVIREWFRRHRGVLPQGDFVIRAFPTIRQRATEDIWDDLTRLSQSVRKRSCNR